MIGDMADVADVFLVILGEERKHLVRPGMTMVEESPSMKETSGGLSEKDI
jgi:hypothetical protein